MLPYLYIFGYALPMYGLIIALGIIASLIYHRLTIKERDFPEADVELAMIYCGIGAAVGAKILWLLTVWPEFIGDIPYLFSQTQAFLQKYVSGGFVFYGGLYGALAVALLYCAAEKLSFFGMMRCLLPIFPLFHGFGRLGCFCVGCCYGIPSEHLGIAFSCSQIAPNGVPLLPVQLIEAGGEFLLFALLARMAKKENSGRNMLCLWLAAYGLIRFVLEFFRADDYRGFLGALSLSQVISIFTVALSAFIFFGEKHMGTEKTG